LKAGSQDAFGRHQEARCRRKSLFEPNVPADFSPDGPATFDGNPIRHRAGGGATRLEQQHCTIRRERGRHPCGLSRSWFGDDDHGTSTIECRDDFWDKRIDRERNNHVDQSARTVGRPEARPLQ
jgi:hypothetical protein